MNNKLRKALVIAVVAAAATPLSSMADHSWGNYHIARDTSSFTLKVVDSVTAEWQTELGDSINQWSQSNYLDLVVDSSDDSSRTRRRCATVAGQMRVCNAAYGQTGWAGLASIGIDANGHIDEGTAKMNDTYGPYPQAFKNQVMCQEIGHVLGLGHTSEDGSSQKTCMDYADDPTDSQAPNAHDYQQLATIYGHLDSYNSYDDGTGGTTPCKGKKCNKAAPPMGVRVKTGKNYEMWAVGRPDGGMTIHHVFLVEGHDGH
jgi:hypothetical protein